MRKEQPSNPKVLDLAEFAHQVQRRVTDWLAPMVWVSAGFKK